MRLEVAVNCGRRADGLRPQRLPHIKRALNFPALDPAAPCCEPGRLALRSQPQAVYAANKKFGLALVDLTTGDFKTTEVEGEAALLTELERLRPAEIIYPTEATWLQELLRNANPILLGYDDWVFALKCCASNVPANFTLHRMNGRLNQLL